MAQRQFVLRIDAGPGTNRTVGQITDALAIVANRITQGTALLTEGVVYDAAHQSIGYYSFEETGDQS